MLNVLIILNFINATIYTNKQLKQTKTMFLSRSTNERTYIQITMRDIINKFKTHMNIIRKMLSIRNKSKCIQNNERTMSTFNFMLQATLMIMLQQQFLIQLQNIKSNCENGKCMTLKSFCFLHVFEFLAKQCHMFMFFYFNNSEKQNFVITF